MNTSDCIVPDAPRDQDGYSRTGRRGLYQRWSRVAYCEFHKVSILSIKGQIVRHECDNRACINPLHLLLGTQWDNVQDMIERGRFAYRKGENAPNVKLTEDDVRRIRASYESGISVITISKIYSLTRGHIYQILNRKLWTHI